jgi:hypothetical protein
LELRAAVLNYISVYYVDGVQMITTAYIYYPFARK